MTRRSIGSPRVLVLLLALLAVGFSSSCAYYNSLYNAKKLFSEAEVARWEGRDGLARTRYGDALEKATISFRRSDSGRWSSEALLLIGRSHLQRGDRQMAKAALLRSRSISGGSEIHGQALAYLGIIALMEGSPDQGAAMLDSALVVVRDPAVRSEARVWLGRNHLRAGRLEEGWAELGRAGEEGERFRELAEFERLRQGIDNRDSLQLRLAVGNLLEIQRAASRVEAVGQAVDRAAVIWGPRVAYALVAELDESPWNRDARRRLLLRRARFAEAAGNHEQARVDAGQVAASAGRLADDARVFIARLELARVQEIEELEEVRRMLLPAVGARDAVVLLDAIRKVGLMFERASTRNQMVGIFAAGEMARDTLLAPRLAKELFLTYAAEDVTSPWRGKAFLAARDLSDDPAERLAIELRMDSLSDNVYIAASRRMEIQEVEYTNSERRLGSMLGIIRAQVHAEAQVRDVSMRQAALALDSLRTAQEIARRIAEGDSLLVDSLRLDSLRRDSLRVDSILRDSIGPDSGRDTIFNTPPPDSTGVASNSLRPVLIRLRSETH